MRLDRLVGIGLSGRRRRGRWSFWAEGWALVARAGLGSWAVGRKEARGGLGRAGLSLLGFGVGSLLLFLFQATLNLVEFKLAPFTAAACATNAGKKVIMPKVVHRITCHR